LKRKCFNALIDLSQLTFCNMYFREGAVNTGYSPACGAILFVLDGFSRPPHAAYFAVFFLFPDRLCRHSSIPFAVARDSRTGYARICGCDCARSGSVVARETRAILAIPPKGTVPVKNGSTAQPQGLSLSVLNIRASLSASKIIVKYDDETPAPFFNRKTK
jgi:hypothetical protein